MAPATRRASSPGGRRGRGAAAGFTLIEMTVVVAVIGVALALVLPGMGDGLRRFRLQAAVREFVALVKFTRTQAVTGRAPLLLVVDRGLNVYWLDRPTPEGVPTAEQAMARGVRVFALPTAIHFGGVDAPGADPGLERAGILFYPRGSSSGGEVQIQDEKGRAYTVRVDLLTGQARTSVGHGT